MPQGGLLEDEQPLDGALRELEEETGTRRATMLGEHPEWLRYEIPLKWRPPTWENRYCGQEQKWFCMRFDGRDEELIVETEDPEFNSWRWATPDEVIAGAIEFKRELYPAVIAAFRDWL